MLKAARIFLRVVLAVAFVASLAVIYRTSTAGQITDGTWGAIAGALAVVAAVVSAFTTQQSFELQQDAQRPYPYPSVDAHSRYQLLQLRVTNTGGTAAHNIRLKWNKRLLKSNGEPVTFCKQEGAPDISILLPGQSIAARIDDVAQFFPAVKDANYTGYVEFEDASGNQHSHKFHISMEDLRSSLTYDEEDTKTHYELQKLPEKIDGLIRELRGIRGTLENQGNAQGPRTLSD